MNILNTRTHSFSEDTVESFLSMHPEGRLRSRIKAVYRNNRVGGICKDTGDVDLCTWKMKNRKEEF